MTQREALILEKLKSYKLSKDQVEIILHNYNKKSEEKVANKYQTALDQGFYFYQLNSGAIEREFTIVCSPADQNKRGVYKISFGSKFYIGRAKLIGSRMRSHNRELKLLFKSGKPGKNHYLRKVFRHLQENILEYYFNVEVLEECYTVEELQQKEQKWLTKYKDSPNCLNVSFIARKPINEIDDTPEQYQEKISNTIVRRAKGGKGGKARLIFIPKDSIKEKIRTRSKSTEQQKTLATDYDFKVPEISSDLGSTVYKLYYGDRYIINKGKYLSFSLIMLQRGCGNFIAYKRDEKKTAEPVYHHKFYQYIKDNPGKDFKVEIILSCDDALEILIAEQKALTSSYKDKKCLNNNIDAYIPKYNPEKKMHNWITPEQVEKFYSIRSSL